MPFGEYDDFDDCTSQNQDKNDPGAYCAEVHYQITGEYPGQDGSADEKTHGAAGKVIDLIGSLVGMDVEDSPGDLNTDGSILRVWVDEAEHAPAGYPTHRCPGGVHYYDVPLPELERATEPDACIYVERVEAGAGAQHPHAMMAEKLESDVARLIDSKEWVPYEGPKGGSGWQNSISGAVRYVNEQPGPEPVDPDSITEGDLADTSIQETAAWRDTSASDVSRGDPIQFYDQSGKTRRGIAEEVDDDSIYLRTQRGPNERISIGPGGEAEGIDIERPVPIFMGSGPAGADTPWLPRDGEPSDVQLAAEAVRSAAATEGYGDVEPLGSFVGLALERGADEEDLRNALDFAAEHHPVLPEGDIERAFNEGKKLTEEHDDEWLEQLHYERAAAGDPPPRPTASPSPPAAEAKAVGGPDPDGDPVFVDNMIDVPPGKVVHHDEDGGLFYYDEADNLEPTEPEKVSDGGVAAKQWVPYQGPQGGTGWTNMGTGEVSYQDEPPGETMSVDDLDANQLEAIADNLGVTVGKVREGLDEAVARATGDDDDGSADVFGPDGASLPEEISIGNAKTAVRNLSLPEDDVGRDAVAMAEDVHADVRGNFPFDAEEWVEAVDLLADKVGGEEGDAIRAEYEENIDIFLASPFAGAVEDAPEHMDPSRAEEVNTIEDVLPREKRGVSASSMYIADGVPGPGGESRRLFVTNTNSDRADERGVKAETEGDAQRAMAGYDAMREAGFAVPEHYHEEGEFWVVSEQDGSPAKDAPMSAKTRVDPDEFTRLCVSSLLVGNWDLHGDNVFVTDDGGLAPIDLDLSGSALHADADSFDNKYSVDQERAVDRFESLARDLSLTTGVTDGNSYDWDDFQEMIREKADGMVESGEANDIRNAATANLPPDLEAKVDENLFKMQDGEFFEDPDASDKPAIDRINDAFRQ